MNCMPAIHSACLGNIPLTMNQSKREAFNEAFEVWRADPIQVVEIRGPLLEVMGDLHRRQETMGEHMTHFHETGIAPKVQGVDRWHDGMTWMLLREVRAIRRHLQRGHNQVMTRQLLARTLAFKSAWDPFRAAAGV